MQCNGQSNTTSHNDLSVMKSLEQFTAETLDRDDTWNLADKVDCVWNEQFAW